MPLVILFVKNLVYTFSSVSKPLSACRVGEVQVVMKYASLEMSYTRVTWLFVSLSLILFASARAQVPAIIVFGDSSVDSGNNNVIPTLLKSNFKPYGRDFYGGHPTGRFCNGRIPPDFISEAFGLKPAIPAYLDPAYTISDFATGVCFASAGTGYDNATSKVLVSPRYRVTDM